MKVCMIFDYTLLRSFQSASFQGKKQIHKYASYLDAAGSRPSKSDQAFLDSNIFHNPKSLVPCHRLSVLSDLRIGFTTGGRNAILLFAFAPFPLWNESLNALKFHMILRRLRSEHINDNPIFINKEVCWELKQCFIPPFTFDVFKHHFEINVRRVFSKNG
mmetsp:Transcript_21077/g.42168  ORF Transcript_21077/g.42168 Transcript_21077/m.42168 type:complete len:160 (-) Transcript_21077:516-995(-)